MTVNSCIPTKLCKSATAYFLFSVLNAWKKANQQKIIKIHEKGHLKSASSSEHAGELVFQHNFLAVKTRISCLINFINSDFFEKEKLLRKFSSTLVVAVVVVVVVVVVVIFILVSRVCVLAISVWSCECHWHWHPS